MTSPLPRPSSLLACAAVALAVLVAGCAPSSSSSSNSTSKFKGDARLAAQTVEDLQAAANDGDEAEICDQLLARSFAGRLASGGRACRATVHDAVRDADTFGMTVDQVRVTGDRATADVTLDAGKHDRSTTVELVREGGRWKIASL